MKPEEGEGSSQREVVTVSEENRNTASHGRPRQNGSRAKDKGRKYLGGEGGRSRKKRRAKANGIVIMADWTTR